MADDAQQWNGHGVGAGLLRRLKGAPLSVLVALALYGEQGRPGLVRRTGWSRSAVSNALNDLVDMGLVQRIHFRGWALREGLGAALLAPLWGQPRRAEGEYENLSAVEPAFDEPGAEGMPENPSGYEGLLHNLWDHERLADGFWAERLSEDLSRNQGFANDLSAREGPRRVRAERLRHNLSASERLPAFRSASHDHDGDHHRINMNNDHHDHHEDQARKMDAEEARVLQGLAQLQPPFDHAEEWLQDTSVELVGAWLDYLQDMTPKRRKLIRNQAAFLRFKVESGRYPPARHADPRRAPCPTCGRTLRDAQGQCLVCAGVVMV